MSIVLPIGRPAIDIVNGSYENPDEPWSSLAEPATKARIEQAIAAVGRIDLDGVPGIQWGGTGFVVGPDLIMTNGLVGYLLEKRGENYCFKPGASAAIDFGHERSPADSVRATIEEVVYVDPHTSIELVRAKLPSNITPLKLSLAGYAELDGRAVAAIGYPAWDPRIEASVLQRIFRGVVDVKRLLPGRALGIASFQPSQNRQVAEVLAHDCTTTGGCGGAPLVDLGTGLVVGIHFAGFFLEANYAILASALTANEKYFQAGTAFAGRKAPTRRSVAVEPIAKGESVVTNGNLESAPSVPDLTGDIEDNGIGVSALEAIILRHQRPALLAESWKSEVNDSWKDILKPFEQRVDLALRAVGKLFKDVEQDQWIGTAFLVGEKLALTASIGLEALVDGAGAQTVLKRGMKAAIDFSDALGAAPKSAIASITGVKFIHPFFDLALLEIDRAPKGTATLSVASQLPSELAGRPVTMLSFASGSPEPVFDEVYQKKWGRLFVQPGRALQVGQIPGSLGLPALVHDCISVSGSSGGPVLDLGTGYAIGIHTHSRPFDTGMAQAAWEFARDPYIWQYDIGLWPNPRPSWLAEWDTPLQQRQQKPDEPASKIQRWTVDDVPIDWSKSEPKALEKLLIQSIEAQMGLYYAEGRGLQIGSVPPNLPPVLFWREILKRASLAGILRPLLEEIATNTAGIAPKLREFL